MRAKIVSWRIYESRSSRGVTVATSVEAGRAMVGQGVSGGDGTGEDEDGGVVGASCVDNRRSVDMVVS